MIPGTSESEPSSRASSETRRRAIARSSWRSLRYVEGVTPQCQQDSKEATKDLKKIRQAVRKLPKEFLSSVKRLYAIGEGGEGGAMPLLMMTLVAELFNDMPAGVDVVQRTPLTPAEAEALRSQFH